MKNEEQNIESITTKPIITNTAIGGRVIEPKKAQPIKPKNSETKTLVEALNKFQALNISALKSTDNTYFKSTYADLTSVIDAVNQGAKYGLCFTQQVQYKNMVLDKQINDTFKDGATKQTSGQVVNRDIWVKTTIYHTIDEKMIECDVPVLINSAEKDNPQKMGSAITYAKRYGLQALFGLGQDDDGNTASGVTDKGGKNGK
tara:strand:- start:467 stop:1072 length:606 start_codon:yes stop_codon:yes gene_type:complete